MGTEAPESQLLDACKLCRFVDETLQSSRPTEYRQGAPIAIAQDDHWIVAVNENQATLGRIYLVLRRHEEDVASLTSEEQASMFRQVRRVRVALTQLFAPDHFNYMFHMNLVRHAHFHIYPRYASVRHFAGVHFHDPEYGNHYNPSAELALDIFDLGYLQMAIREAYTRVGEA